jgi:hypothetical protein
MSGIKREAKIVEMYSNALLCFLRVQATPEGLPYDLLAVIRYPQSVLVVNFILDSAYCELLS